MISTISWHLIQVVIAATSFAANSPTNVSNVILITFDGVRRSEIFNERARTMGEGILFEAWVDNPARISLPGYQNLMSGSVQPCVTNDCSRVSVETMPERIRRELKLEKNKVAGIMSWMKTPLAFESHEGTVFTNGGFAKPEAKDFGSQAESLGKLQNQEKPHWEENRFDKYTWSLAMAYLQKNHPRFLYIGLNDTDDWAHEGNAKGYEASLKQYDAWLGELFTKLKKMGQYGRNTTVILTTDHGRGTGEMTETGPWRNHNDKTPGSEEIWMYIRGPKTPKLGKVSLETRATHSDVRPTVEKFLGLKPTECEKCGHPIEKAFEMDNRIGALK